MPLGLLDQEEERILTIQQREKQSYANLNVPGRNRQGMPPVPFQSKRHRDA